MRGLLVLTWFSAATCALGLMARHDSQPGASLPVRERAAELPASAAGRRAQVVMALHPQCPCSRASLEELTQSLSRGGSNMSALVLAYAPVADPERWRNAPGCRAAAAIPGVQVRTDAGGIEARRLGASTSGHVVLFDREGKRLFSGGITGGRAMVGDNPGYEAALEALRTGKPATLAEMPVYGCPLFTIQASNR